MTRLGGDILAALFFSLLSVWVFDVKIDSVGVSFFLTTTETIFFIIFFSKCHLNLKLVYFIFNLVFFCAVPWINYSNRVLIWRSTYLSDYLYIYINSIVFVFNMLLFFVAKFVRKNEVRNIDYARPFLTIGVVGYVLTLATSTIGFLITFYLNDFSFESLFLRGAFDELGIVKIEESSIQLLVGQVARFLPFFVFVFVATEIKSHFLLKMCLFLLLLLTVFPSGVPRYMVGMVYIPISVLYFKKLREGRFFSYFLIGSLLLLFPFLDQFRSFNGVDKLRFLPGAEFFQAAHFDAYENFASAIDYGYVSYGWQILGVFLFFIPRVIWPNKPIGSGAQMAEDFNYVFTNISMPFFGEGYVNFGIFGTAIFLIFLFYIIQKIDLNYNSIEINKKIRFEDIFYFYLMASLFFILRGDLLSSFAYTMNGVFVYFIVGGFLRQFSSAKLCFR